MRRHLILRAHVLLSYLIDEVRGTLRRIPQVMEDAGSWEDEDYDLARALVAESDKEPRGTE